MPAKLSVTVAVDMDSASVTLRPAGSLTPENVQGLLAVVRRAARVLPGFGVLLDLDQLHVGCPEAFRALSQAGARTIHRHHAPGGYRRTTAARAAA
jgi:hypothetical protein